MKDAEQEVTGQVGSNLRDIRKARKLSLEELATLCDVSKLTLGKIERGEANPTLQILWKIARGLQIPLSSLLSFQDDIALYRFADRHSLAGHNHDWFVEPLYKTNGTMEWYRACIEPHTRHREFHLEGSEETVFVLNGQLELMVGGKTYHLEKWDVIRFQGEEQHTYINSTDEKVYLMLSLAYKNA